jgi:hypothetical protein
MDEKSGNQLCEQMSAGERGRKPLRAAAGAMTEATVDLDNVDVEVPVDPLDVFVDPLVVLTAFGVG